MSSALPTSNVLAPIQRLWNRFLAWGVMSVGSSRSSALIRIGLGLIIWTRFAYEQLPYRYEFGWHTAFSVLFYVFTTLMIVGYRARITTFVAGLLTMSFYYYFGLVSNYEPYTHHHTYILGIATVLCALTPCDKSYSLDRWLAVREARRRGQPPPPEAGNLWGLRLIVIQLTMMYFWTAVDKLHPGFLEGDRLEALFMYYYIGSSLADWAAWSWVFAVAAWIVVIVEFALTFFLPFRRTRKFFVLPGLALHLCFYLMLPVFTYTVTVILLYLAYFDADRVHQILDDLQGHSSERRSR